MPWYSGPTLLEHLETVPLERVSSVGAIRFPVQYVMRPDAAFRGFAGQVSGGAIRPGDVVMALPSRQTTRVRSIVTFDGELAVALPSQSITLQLEDEIDLSRGDMLVSPDAPPTVSKHLSAMLVWLNEAPLRFDRTYLLKHTTRQVKATVRRIQYRVDINTLSHESSQELQMNGIAAAEIETSGPLFFDSYEFSRLMGSFILIDPLTNATVGAGMIQTELEPAKSAAQTGGLEGSGTLAVTAKERVARRGHRPAILLIPEFVAGLAERALFARGFETTVLSDTDLSSDSFEFLLSRLWSAAFLVLVSAGKVPFEARRKLETVAGDSLLDCASGERSGNRDELLAEILLHAESLRVRPAAWAAGDPD